MTVQYRGRASAALPRDSEVVRGGNGHSSARWKPRNASTAYSHLTARGALVRGVQEERGGS